MSFHVLNRGVGRRTLFEADKDYIAFLGIGHESLRTAPMRICAFCLMLNHWHLLLWPQRDGQLAAFVQKFSNTHVQRAHQRVGEGILYQGRYKSLPVQSDEHFLTVARYVEGNALRAGLVARAEEWPWCSLQECFAPEDRFLAEWPLARPSGWVNLVNGPRSEAEVNAIRRCLRRGCPYGEDGWMQQTAARLGLDSTPRGRGRPRKQDGG
jgi:putative transposase